MVGRFKTETGEKMFYQPLAVVTKSGIENGVWIKRTIDAYAKLGIVSGPFFRVKRKGGGVQRCKPNDLDPDFHSILLRVQARYPHIIPSSVNVMEEYRIRRSLRRGSTTHAGNMSIPKEVIEANNRGRKHGNSRSVLPGMSMVERYSDAKDTLVGMLERHARDHAVQFGKRLVHLGTDSQVERRRRVDILPSSSLPECSGD
eukprot:scaffold242487_cov33-Attheya_sp.AAC.1